MKIRDWLIKIRGKRSQQEIADLCGISQNFYSCLETGERQPSVKTAKKIASVLGFDWTLFFQDEEDFKNNTDVKTA